MLKNQLSVTRIKKTRRRRKRRTKRRKIRKKKISTKANLVHNSRSCPATSFTLLDMALATMTINMIIKISIIILKQMVLSTCFICTTKRAAPHASIPQHCSLLMPKTLHSEKVRTAAQAVFHTYCNRFLIIRHILAIFLSLASRLIRRMQPTTQA